MSISHLYARVSHHMSAHGDSVNDQINRGNEYYDRHLKHKCKRLIEYKDTAVSAYTIRFAGRQAGKTLLANIQRGDHVIFDKLDRACRSCADFMQLIEYFDMRGVRVHIINLSGMEIDTGSPTGKLFLTIMSAAAEFESGLKSERIKAAFAQRVEEGVLYTSTPMLGMKVLPQRVGNKIKKFVQWDPEECALMEEIREMRDVAGLGYERITEILNRDAACRAGQTLSQFTENCRRSVLRKARRTRDKEQQKKLRKRTGLPWKPTTVEAWYYRARLYAHFREQGIETPRDTMKAFQKWRKEKYPGYKRGKNGVKMSNLPDNELSPSRDALESLPQWARDQIDTPMLKSIEHFRPKVFESLGTLEQFNEMVAKERQEQTEEPAPDEPSKAG